MVFSVVPLLGLRMEEGVFRMRRTHVMAAAALMLLGANTTASAQCRLQTEIVGMVPMIVQRCRIPSEIPRRPVIGESYYRGSIVVQCRDGRRFLADGISVSCQGGGVIRCRNGDEYIFREGQSVTCH